MGTYEDKISMTCPNLYFDIEKKAPKTKRILLLNDQVTYYKGTNDQTGRSEPGTTDEDTFAESTSYSVRNEHTKCPEYLKRNVVDRRQSPVSPVKPYSDPATIKQSLPLLSNVPPTSDIPMHKNDTQVTLKVNCCSQSSLTQLPSNGCEIQSPSPPVKCPRSLKHSSSHTQSTLPPLPQPRFTVKCQPMPPNFPNSIPGSSCVLIPAKTKCILLRLGNTSSSQSPLLTQSSPNDCH